MTEEALVEYLGRLNIGEQHKIINILANRGFDIEISQYLGQTDSSVRRLLGQMDL